MNAMFPHFLHLILLPTQTSGSPYCHATIYTTNSEMGIKIFNTLSPKLLGAVITFHAEGDPMNKWDTSFGYHVGDFFIDFN